MCVCVCVYVHMYVCYMYIYIKKFLLNLHFCVVHDNIHILKLSNVHAHYHYVHQVATVTVELLYFGTS